MPAEALHTDVLIVGAGISGIGAAYYLQTECPDRRYAILEGPSDFSGTITPSPNSPSVLNYTRRIGKEIRIDRV